MKYRNGQKVVRIYRDEKENIFVSSDSNGNIYHHLDNGTCIWNKDLGSYMHVNHLKHLDYDLELKNKPPNFRQLPTQNCIKCHHCSWYHRLDVFLCVKFDNYVLGSFPSGFVCNAYELEYVIDK